MPSQNAVAAIRVSTAKQGFNGDSPEAQKEQIERFAAARGITIKEFFIQGAKYHDRKVVR